MSALGRFEQFMENIVEGSARRLFRSRVTAAEITRRLERAMESQQTITVDRIIVPSFYRASLHPEDFRAFEPIQAELEQEMGIYLLELARERGFTLLQHPVVDVVPNTSTPRHAIQVVAEMVASPQQHLQQDASYVGTQVMLPQGSSRPVQQPVQAEFVLRQPDGDYRFPLMHQAVMIGRGLGNDIVLDDPRVSRQHARIRGQAQHFFVADQGSTNGTYVNGTRISGEHPLRSGDIVSLGGLELKFQQ